MVRTWRILAFSVLGLIFLIHATAGAIATTLLQPPDTSSPRATLKSFVDSIDEAFSAFETSLLSYRASKRLYFSREEEHLFRENRAAAARAIECLDLSKVPANIHGALSHEEAIFLLEILHRIPLPDISTVPDREGMLKSGKKRWRIPGTRIEIALIEQGSRSGEYLFSAGTVEQLRTFYHQVKHLPYKPGSVRRVTEVYKSQGFGDGSFYQAYLDSPIRLADFIPFRWMAALPRPVKTELAGMALWKWLVLLVIALVCAGGVWIVYHLVRKARTAVPVVVVATPLGIALAGKFFQDFATTKIRVGETALTVVGAGGTLITFVALAVAVFLGGVVIGDGIVRSQRMRSRSMDAQLIRLIVRLVGVIGALALLIECAARLGIPAYSVLAGLGIGGLAVALAAQDSLANLFASIIIMFEKPFRVGQWIKVGTNEGIVEHVGFRSTRIRTFHDSLISIPNSDVVKTSIDNLGAREKRRQRFFLQIKYDTPPERVGQFVSEIRRLIEAHEKVDAEKYFIHFNNMGESALEILLYFYLRVEDYAEELREREGILLQLLELAEKVGVTFAFPTRTLQVESAEALSRASTVSLPARAVTSIR